MSTIRNLPDSWRSSTRRAGPAASVNVPSNRTGTISSAAEFALENDTIRQVFSMPEGSVRYHPSRDWGYGGLGGGGGNGGITAGTGVRRGWISAVGSGGGGSGGITQDMYPAWDPDTKHLNYEGVMAIAKDIEKKWPPAIKRSSDPQKDVYTVDMDVLRKDLNLSVNLTQVGNKLEVKVGLSDRNGVEFSFDSDFVELDP